MGLIKGLRHALENIYAQLIFELIRYTFLIGLCIVFYKTFVDTKLLLNENPSSFSGIVILFLQLIVITIIYYLPDIIIGREKRYFKRDISVTELHGLKVFCQKILTNIVVQLFLAALFGVIAFFLCVIHLSFIADTLYNFNADSFPLAVWRMIEIAATFMVFRYFWVRVGDKLYAMFSPE